MVGPNGPKSSEKPHANILRFGITKKRRNIELVTNSESLGNASVGRKVCLFEHANDLCDNFTISRRSI